MRIYHIFIIVSLFGLGCSSGTFLYYNGGGNRCDGNDQLPSTAVGVDWQEEGKGKPLDQRLPAGYYTYRGMAAYFYDSKTNVHIEVQETPDTNNVLQPG